jgi:EAL domain-containing protein (putative c-di-GMP-specific phosphodiesterase class I)
MDLEAIVEGVETEEELQILEKLGVEAVQGFYFSRPQKAEQTFSMLAASPKIAVAS